MFSEDDLLPVSGLQHLAFCERRWALVELERQWEENRFTAEGELLHEKAHSGEVDSRPGTLIRRAMPLRSLRLGLSGQADVVEFVPCAPDEAGIALRRRKGKWRIYPVEYKRRRERIGESYEVQLCAQALCLEEMLEVTIPAGAIFDGKARRRTEVLFAPALREEVERLAGRMREILQSMRTPAPDPGRKCAGCSMNPVCLPEVLGSARASRYLNRVVAANLAQLSGHESSKEGSEG